MNMQKKYKKIYWSIALSAVVILMLLASYFIQSLHPYKGVVLALSLLLEINIWRLQRK